ncbi:MAG: right-handed parallel beta-helix repeat-containing protein, partial [Saprospiraceae bacterium]|nr:right-handed parallel beta-helix repeat-containing protein [Saprospiraceae bacterium]
QKLSLRNSERLNHCITSFLSLPKQGKILRLLVVIMMALGNTAQAQKFIKQTASGTGSGNNWNNAMGASSLRSALAAGGTIYIAAGSYNVGASSVSDAVVLPAGTVVQGGFPTNATGTQTSGYNPVANVTLIDGQDRMIMRIQSGTYAIRGIVFDNAEGQGNGGPCINANAGGQTYDWTIEDCTFKNTTGSGGGGGAVFLQGSYFAGSKVKIRNCIFDNNQGLAGSFSGALMIHGVANASPGSASNNGTDYVVEGCSFTNNRVTGGASGGAVQVLSSSGINFINNSFCNNFANNDAGALLVASTTKFVMSGCTFSGNTNQGQYGPAAYFLSSPEAQILNCSFVNNSSAPGAQSNSAGGGLCIQSGTQHLILGCRFYNNTVNQRGGGFEFGGGGSFTMSNCIFKGNRVVNSTGSFGGGAIFAATGSSASVALLNNIYDGNTLVDNTGAARSGYGGGAILVVGGNGPVVLNSTFYNNSYNNSTNVLKSDVAVAGSGNFTVSNSRLQLSQPTYIASYIVTVGNTFSNSTAPSIPGTPVLTCPTSLVAVCNAGVSAPNLGSPSAMVTCPATSFDLSTVQVNNMPVNTTLTWHTASSASSANWVSDPAAVAPGVYYAAVYDSANNCYSPASTPFVVNYTACCDAGSLAPVITKN